jgi:hypothetical protein
MGEVTDARVLTTMQNVVFQSLTLPEVLDNSRSHVGDGSLFNAYCQTFYYDRFTEHYLPPGSFLPHMEASREAFHYYITFNASSIIDFPVGTAIYGNFAYRLCQECSFFTMEEGCIGLAPKATKAGNLVCVVLGCHSPLIFRPTENGWYKVVVNVLLVA